MVDEKSKPTTLKSGMPPEQNNGLFGDLNQERIMALGVKGRFAAVVLFDVADIIHSEASDSTRPVVEFAAIEPIWSEEGKAAATKVRDDAYKARTGADQLDLDDIVDDTAGDAQAADDAAFEAAAPKAAKK